MLLILYIIIVWTFYRVDLRHYFFIIGYIQVVYLTRVRVQVVQQWRVIVMKSIVISTDRVWVDVLAEIPVHGRSGELYDVVSIIYIVQVIDSY